MDTSQFHSSVSSPINIPRVAINEDYLLEEEMDIDGEYRGMTQVLMRSPNLPGSPSAIPYASPKLPQPSDDFSHVMVKLNTGLNNISSSYPLHNVSRETPELRRSHDSEPHLENYKLTSVLSPTSGRRRPRRNVRFDEATITVTAEMGESAARFRSRWRHRNGLGSSPPIRFGSKNVVVQHDENSIDEENLPIPSVNNHDTNGKSIFDVCNYTSYGRYT